MNEATGNTQMGVEFLDECGLSELSQADKDSLIRRLHSELELRGGERLSHGLSEAQLDEFADIHDGFIDRVDEWLAGHAPDFEESEIFRRLASMMPDASADSLKREAASALWLEANRPDYRSVVRGVREEMREELIRFRDVLLEEA